MDFLIFCLTACTIIMSYVHTCSIEMDGNRCQYIINCQAYINQNVDVSEFRHSYHTDDYQLSPNRCLKLVRHNYEIFYPVKLILTRNNDNCDHRYTIPKLNIDYSDYYDISYHFNILVDIICSLDISDSGCQQIPIISRMKNLAILNISHNSLTTAVLSNPNELDALTEMDVSYNNISDIQVKNNEYAYTKLTSLNMSHNAITKITDSIFDKFEKLQVLDLSYNHIETLNTFTFKGISKLIVLNLSQNQLTSFNNSLLAFKQLTALNVSGNKITNLRQDDFKSLVSLVNLDLSSNIIKDINENIFQTMTALENLDLRNNLIKTIFKKVFSNSKLLKNIDLSKNLIEELPEGLFVNNTIFKFSITENKLEGPLTKGLLHGLHVVELDISKQFITEIQEYAFYNLFSLESLLLSFNRIQSLSDLSFKTLKHLQKLDLSNNQLTNIDFDKQDLIKLESLFLNNNRLTEITESQLLNLGSLKYLDLSGNLISLIKPLSLNSLRNVISFKIYSNKLVNTLETDTFNGLILLPSLDLSHNMITTVQNASFRNMGKLRELNISGCDISEMQYNGFINTGYIELIDLSHNKLTNFFINATELVNLHTLLLNDNLIEFIAPAVLRHTIHLFVITLFHNTINRLNPEGMNHIDSMDLRHNNFSTLQIGDFTGMTDLKYLDLSFNEIIYIQPGVFEDNTELMSLNISHNRLSVINYGIFRGLPALQVLNMSHNNIQDLRSERFFELTNLKKLILDYNKIDFVEAIELPSLTSLSIGDNPLPCQILVQLHKKAQFEITAIALKKHFNENVNGVTCNNVRETEESILISKYNNVNTTQNFSSYKQVGFEDKGISYLEKIKNILENMNSAYEEKISALYNSTNTVIKLLGQTLVYINDTKMPFLNNNYKSISNLSYTPSISSTQGDLENVVTSQNSNVANGTEKYGEKNKGSNESALALKHEKIVIEREVSTSTFTDTCLVLILISLIGIFLYNFYKHRMFLKNSFIQNTRELPDTVENTIF